MKRILVRGPNWIGDHVMAFPFYRGLRRLYPKAHITLTSNVKANEIDFRAWDEFVPFAALYNAQFDLGITLPASISSAFFLFRLGVPIRVGFAEFGANLFLTDSLRWIGRESGKHKSELYGDLLRWLGGEPEFAALTTRNEAPTKRKILVAPQASLALREWPHFPELVRALNDRFPFDTVTLVGPSTDSVTQYERLGARFENYFGRTSVTELCALIRSADLVIANDSGVAHLAGHFGTPVVVLYGPGDPRYIRPAGNRVITIRDTDLPCSPCEKSYCRAPYGYQRCLRNLSVDEVLRAIQ
ncbi:MAG: glycosyltransferase family 9 protein [Deltaproteobacteria bacterium]|nr:glycosyltransferase family 9 protein [Deltaproteobacteria bacterium]MBI3293278.1 glycosyltransferase family 9 protein [Deltaproteobacteria bacterium]